MTWSELVKLVKASPVKDLNPHITDQKPAEKKKKVKLPAEDCKQVTWMKWQLWYFCLQSKLEWKKEYKFHPKRRWKFDFAIPSLKIGIEYEGLNSDKSRHTTLIGYTGDTKKYNAASAGGWIVLRFTALTYKDLIQELKKVIDASS